MAPDLDAILDLRLRTAAHTPPDAGAARAYLAKPYAPLLASARRVEALRGAGRLIGLVLVSGPQPSRFGDPEASALVLLEPGADGALEWAARTLRALGLETLYGLTSNPAVFHIGRQIGRRVSRIVMRRDGPFIAETLLPTR